MCDPEEFEFFNDTGFFGGELIKEDKKKVKNIKMNENQMLFHKRTTNFFRDRYDKIKVKTDIEKSEKGNEMRKP